MYSYGLSWGSQTLHSRPNLMLDRDSDYVENSLRMMARKVEQRPAPLVVDVSKRSLAFGIALHVCSVSIHLFSWSANQTNQNNNPWNKLENFPFLFNQVLRLKSHPKWVKKHILKMKKLKATGLHAFSGLLFKNQWPTVGTGWTFYCWVWSPSLHHPPPLQCCCTWHWFQWILRGSKSPRSTQMDCSTAEPDANTIGHSECNMILGFHYFVGFKKDSLQMPRGIRGVQGCPMHVTPICHGQ